MSSEEDEGSGCSDDYNIHVSSITHGDYKLNFKERDYYFDYDGFTHISGVLTNGGVEVGKLKAQRVDRCEGIDNFHQICDAHSQELQEAGCLCCDRFGKIRKTLNGLIPEEDVPTVNEGGFVLIDEVRIHPEHRGKQLGLALIRGMFEFLGDRWTLCVAQPYPLSNGDWQYFNGGQPEYPDRWAEPTTEEKERTRAGIITVSRYFARLGFRQIGRGQFWVLGRGQLRGADNLVDTKALEVRQAEAPPPPPTGLEKLLMDTIRGGPADGMPLFMMGQQAALPADIAAAKAQADACAAAVTGPGRKMAARVSCLLQNGVNPNACAALHCAAAQPDGVGLDSIQLLLGYPGIEVNRVAEGSTPLHVAANRAAQFAKPEANAASLRVIQLLIGAGADPMATTGDGATTLDVVDAVVQDSMDFQYALLGGRSLTPENVRARGAHTAALKALLSATPPPPSLLTRSDGEW